MFTATYLRSDPMLETLEGDGLINTLFVIEAKGKPLCSYVLIYYPATKRAAIFDIPGALGLIIEKINRVDRIDRVYESGRIEPYRDEVEKLLGIEVPFSVVITLENLGKITDLIEGVELFIPSPVDEHHDGHVLFPSGLTVLDGDKAKVYVTYELPEESEELTEYRRQRFFIGLLSRLEVQNEFLKNPQAAKVFYSLLKTGLKMQAQARLFDEFAGMDLDRVSIQSVGGNIREVSGQSLIFPHWDGNLIKEIARQTSAGLKQPFDDAMEERIFTVEVLNGTTVSGLAGRTADLYRSFGYDIVSIGNADRDNYENTIIIYRSGLEETIMEFGEVIRCSNIHYESSGFEDDETDLNIQNFKPRVDLTLIIGRDFNGRYVTN